MPVPTSAQQTQARQFLGYPNLYRYKNPRLESTFIEMDADALAVFTDLLIRIQLADDGINGVVSSGEAGVKRVDEIEFFRAGNGQLDPVGYWRSRGRELVGRLSILLGVPVYSDYFGTEGYLGDKYSAGGMAEGGGGGFHVG